MNKQATDWSVQQRQGGPALLIIIFKTVIELIKGTWPFLIAIFLTGKENKETRFLLFAVFFLAFTFIKSLLEYFFFRFQIVNNELIVRKGVFTKKTIVLPLEKIIAVHIEQTWLHQIFNAAQVSFDSAGSIKTEVVIKSMPLQKAELLRQFITESKPAEAAAAESRAQVFNPPLITLSAKDLLMLCISANHIEGIFILVAFGFSVIENIGEATGKETSSLFSWVYERIDTQTLPGLLFMAVLILIISIVVSSLRVILRYSGFSITRSEKGFSIRSGLINTKEKLVPFRKIQFLSWKANWLREKLGIFLLHFHAAGSEEIKDKMEIKVPATQKKFIAEILNDYHDLLPVKVLDFVKTDKAYITRTVLLTGLVPSLILFSAGWFFTGMNAAWVFLLIPYAAFAGWRFWKKFRLWSVPEALQIKKGVWGTEKLILKWCKIQAVHFNQSILQRKRKLATLKLFTAGGLVVIPFIKQETAMQIYNYALYKIESENKSWM